ncbi:uncharacterized protein MELLADRAFT_118355 [Melampsora larici-populina 98AG31]|uniref:RING-type domain-containing protein n=1 Tax=Melampsora larici-populina (strain 98AG31 / pathotype 3-4-7) TaxID=747676 RepID=F4S851_MELLP|nr:uncharacterized protein MELLADRAFT_118355 [Melampsora larici-populina 98AG31]EGF99180.1 hypothetical protein MELLADRAFT_118355 [Melampsora larici-populina 98AG31]
MSFLEYELSSSMTTFNPDLLHLHGSSEPYADQDYLLNINTDSGMLDLQFVSLFSTIWNLFKTNNKSNSHSHSHSHPVLSSTITTTTSDLLSPATSLQRETDLRGLTSTFISHRESLSDRELSDLQQYTGLSTLNPPHESVLKPVATPSLITSFEDSHRLSTPVGSPSISLPRIDLTTVTSNDTLVHTFPASLRATSGGSHHFGHNPYSDTHPAGSISGNQLNSLSKSTCAICMDSINDPSDLIKLSCNHLFHAEGCIIPWIERNPSCPVCRYRLMTVDPLFRNNNLTLPDHLHHAYLEGIFKSHHSQVSSNHSTYPRHNHPNHQAVVTATIWDSYSRFMM